MSSLRPSAGVLTVREIAFLIYLFGRLFINGLQYVVNDMTQINFQITMHSADWPKAQQLGFDWLRAPFNEHQFKNLTQSNHDRTYV